MRASELRSGASRNILASVTESTTLISGTDWTDEENDILVADYFVMLGEEMAGKAYVKAHHRRDIAARIGRSDKSVERKYMNVSAVLMKLGLPRIRGYAPNHHAQFRALAAAIDRYLSGHAGTWEPDVLPSSPLPNDDPFVPAPELRPKSASVPDPIRRLVRKWDPAARDARNRVIGERGEAFVFEVEERRLFSAGRKNLIKDMSWVSKKEGDGAGYDILSFDPATGDRRLIEVKATCGEATMPFFLTGSEETLSRECPQQFRLYRVFDLAARPRIFELRPPLKEAVHLEPATWAARFS